MIHKLRKKVRRHRRHSPARQRTYSRSRSGSRQRSRSPRRPSKSRDRSLARDYRRRSDTEPRSFRTHSVDRYPSGPTYASDSDDRSLRETESIIKTGDTASADTHRDLVPEPPATAPGNASPVLELDIQDDEYSVFLGDDPSSQNKSNFELHKALCTRWSHIMCHGLEKDKKLKLLERYPLPNNCLEMSAPLINPEVSGVLSNPHLRRDEAHLGIQRQLNTGLAALGRGVNIILDDKENIPKEIKEHLLISLGDAGRILSDLSFNISTMRRNLIMPSLNKTVKDLVASTIPLSFLFGSDIGEKIKEAKIIERAKKDLKPEHTPTQPSTSSSYYRRPQMENTRQGVKTNQTSRSTSPGNEAFPGGSQIIRQALIIKGYPECSINTAIASISSSTIKQYEGTYKLWWQYCQTTGTPIYEAEANHVISFLQGLFDANKYQFGTFNSHRSALSLILGEHVHKDSRIPRFMRGISKLRPSRPKYNCTWDPQQVIAFLGTWENSQISLQHLSYKVATLLALVTGQRIQTISLIRPSNLMESPSGIQILITDQIKTSNINKLQPCLQIPFFLEDPSICPATALKHYLNVTKEKRSTPNDHLFITHKRPHKPAAKQTISRWVHNTLKLAGIDTAMFKPHSVRHASTSAARKTGTPMESIMQAAGWTNETTFTKFYQRKIVNTTAFAERILTLQ
nr:unnamed protein product [Callosobruchus chinensis]